MAPVTSSFGRRKRGQLVDEPEMAVELLAILTGIETKGTIDNFDLALVKVSQVSQMNPGVSGDVLNFAIFAYVFAVDFGGRKLALVLLLLLVAMAHDWRGLGE